MNQSSTLEVFPNPYPGRNYEIHIETDEFTNLCPFTGAPDFAKVTIYYVPNRLCIELKSLKMYLQSFRNQAISHEELVNRIVDDIVEICEPVEMQVTIDFNIRGGIHTVVRAKYEKQKK